MKAYRTTKEILSTNPDLSSLELVTSEPRKDKPYPQLVFNILEEDCLLNENDEMEPRFYRLSLFVVTEKYSQMDDLKEEIFKAFKSSKNKVFASGRVLQLQKLSGGSDQISTYGDKNLHAKEINIEIKIA